MKNLVKTKNSQLHIALPVPSGSVAGQVVNLGSAGLTAVLLTDRATTAKVNAGENAPGVYDTEATVELIGVSLVTRQANVPAVSQYAAVYLVPADQTLTLTATNNIKIGYALDTIVAPGPCRIAHV